MSATTDQPGGATAALTPEVRRAVTATTRASVWPAAAACSAIRVLRT